MGRVHLTRLSRAACGREVQRRTSNPRAVTCRLCKRTIHYADALIKAQSKDRKARRWK